MIPKDMIQFLSFQPFPHPSNSKRTNMRVWTAIVIVLSYSLYIHTSTPPLDSTPQIPPRINQILVHPRTPSNQPLPHTHRPFSLALLTAISDSIRVFGLASLSVYYQTGDCLWITAGVLLILRDSSERDGANGEWDVGVGDWCAAVEQVHCAAADGGEERGCGLRWDGVQVWCGGEIGGVGFCVLLLIPEGCSVGGG
jgi:hypothetical protein